MTGISRLLIAAPVLAAMAVAPAVAKADWHGRGGYGGGGYGGGYGGYHQQAQRAYYPQYRHGGGGNWAGAALAAGIIGLGVGAIVANSQPAYAYPPAYYAAPTYYAPPPAYYAPPPVYVAPGYYPAYPRY